MSRDELVEDAGGPSLRRPRGPLQLLGLHQGPALDERLLVEEVGPVGQNGVGVDVVDARQEEVVRVDQVVRDGREVGLDPDEQAPAKVEDFPGAAGGFPV